MTGRTRSMTKFYDMAVILSSQTRHDLAIEQLRRSLAEDPDHAASHSLLGICLARLKRPTQALAASNDGLRLGPESPFSHHARACVYVHANKLKQARRDIEEAIRLDPLLPSQFFLLSAIQSDERRPARSLKTPSVVSSSIPCTRVCASLRALSLQRLGRKKEAEEAIASALMLDPNNDFTHTAQGWRLLKDRNRDAAREHFLEALRINPENRWRNLAWRHQNQSVPRSRS